MTAEEKRELGEYRAVLAAASGMTEADMRAAVAACPERVRETLARGPLRRRWSCRVCAAFEELGWRSGEVDITDPRWLVFVYHELPKVEMDDEQDCFKGEHANEVYRRCLAIYRAAGWDGEAEEPNA